MYRHKLLHLTHTMLTFKNTEVGTLHTKFNLYRMKTKHQCWKTKITALSIEERVWNYTDKAKYKQGIRNCFNN